MVGGPPLRSSISSCAGKGGTVDETKDDATCLLP
jgi:hypothetical protein